jgi:predicted nucleic acid-binding Zn ribbon protein
MNCPFCQSPLNPGAVVCAHCGATERKVANTKDLVLKFVLPGLVALILIGVVLGYFSLLGILATVGLAAWCYRQYRRLEERGRSTWVRRMG